MGLIICVPGVRNQAREGKAGVGRLGLLRIRCEILQPKGADGMAASPLRGDEGTWGPLRVGHQGVVPGEEAAESERQPRFCPERIACRSSGFALPVKIEDVLVEMFPWKGRDILTRYWPSSRDSLLRKRKLVRNMIKRFFKGDVLHAGSSYLALLLRFLEYAWQTTQLASTTRRLKNTGPAGGERARQGGRIGNGAPLLRICSCLYDSWCRLWLPVLECGRMANLVAYHLLRAI